MGKEHLELAEQLDKLSTILKEEKGCRDFLSISEEDFREYYKKERDDSLSKPKTKEEFNIVAPIEPEKPTLEKEQAAAAEEINRQQKAYETKCKGILILWAVIAFLALCILNVFFLIACLVYVAYLLISKKTNLSNLFPYIKEILCKKVKPVETTADQLAEEYLKRDMEKYEKDMASYRTHMEEYESNCQTLDEYNQGVARLNALYEERYRIETEGLSERYEKVKAEKTERLSQLMEDKKQYDGLLPEKYYDFIDEISQEIKDYKADSVKEAIQVFEQETRDKDRLMEEKRHNRELEQQNYLANLQMTCDNQAHNESIERMKKQELDMQAQHNQAMEQQAKEAQQKALDAQKAQQKAIDEENRRRKQQESMRASNVKAAQKQLESAAENYRLALNRGDKDTAAYYQGQMEIAKGKISANS